MEIVAKDVASQTVKVAASESKRRSLPLSPNPLILRPPKVAEIDTADIEQAMKDPAHERL